MAQASGGIGFLDSVNSAAEWDIAPVTGTNAKQVNRVLATGSGASPSAYDQWPGLNNTDTTADPTFNAGSPNYMEYDGGDHKDLVSGANTVLLRDVHKTTGGTAITFGFMIRTPASFGPASGYIYATVRSTTNHGIKIFVRATGVLVFQQSGGAGNLWDLATLSTSTNYLIMIGVDLTTSATNVEYWVNSSTGITDTDATASATTTNPQGVMRFGAQTVTASAFLWANTREYGIFGLNKVINDTEAAAIISHYEAETGLDFTP